MKKFILTAVSGLFLIVWTASAETVGQQVFDTEGHLLAYIYADGSKERYDYDSSWRLSKFTSREGKETFYSYQPDGRVVEKHSAP